MITIQSRNFMHQCTSMISETCILQQQLSKYKQKVHDHFQIR